MGAWQPYLNFFEDNTMDPINYAETLQNMARSIHDLAQMFIDASKKREDELERLREELKKREDAEIAVLLERSDAIV